ncbi:MAG: hypothetical protein JWL93_1712 [Hyphomicrobiales bacterium]|jgi:hypothetical protein|nr:hypothetical protein [Hyphomicrobiales bacterium]
MKPMPLTHFLPVLDASATRELAPRQIEPPRLPEMLRNQLHLVASNVLPAPQAELEPEPADVAQEAYDRGFEEGRVAAAFEAAALRAEEEARFEERMAAAREEWCREQSGHLATGVEKALGMIEKTICEGAERVLKQVVEESLRMRAVQEFTDSITRLLRDGDAGVVTVHGPADLIEALRPHIEPLSATIEFNESDGAEVWVRVDQTLIETRLAAWRGDLNLEG